MVLPKPEELKQIPKLDIAGFMAPATEVSGDYYDVLKHGDSVKIAIGDVAGHGLESGVLMLMVQVAVRTLLISDVTVPETFLNLLNQVVYDNEQRMNMSKLMTRSLLDYKDGKLCLCGQHEEMLVVRKGGYVERIDTLQLGFMIGIKLDISNLINKQEIELKQGDGIVLYTDGITEGRNQKNEFYGLERLCQIISKKWSLSALEVQKSVISDVLQHIGQKEIDDDITLLVLKQK